MPRTARQPSNFRNSRKPVWLTPRILPHDSGRLPSYGVWGLRGVAVTERAKAKCGVRMSDKMHQPRGHRGYGIGRLR